MSRRSNNNIVVRMYNIGFGDSFLVRFTGPDGVTRKVLIDCGVHRTASIKPPPIKDVVARIIDDVTDSDNVPRIDVVVATHRHQDHVYGFENGAWGDVEVKEVWMPWTEHPTDEKAKEIRDAQSKAAQHTLAAAQRRMQMSLTAAEREKMERAMVLASNNLTNKKAMATLHSGFSRNGRFALRRYMPEKEGGRTFESLALPGVTVHVMGPSRDPDVIRDMEEETEMYHLLGVSAEPSAEYLPFHRGSMLTKTEFEKDYAHLVLPPRNLEAIDRAGQADEFAAAASLDNAVNGTSLMIMFEVGKAFLLFPGDAQWGTWQRALENERWNELLSKTTFYKIGHHGSHNATPITFVEKVLGKNFWAMACTGPTKKWSDIIPRKKLLEALRKKSRRVVRSDTQDVADPEVKSFKRDSENAYVEVELRI